MTNDDLVTGRAGSVLTKEWLFVEASSEKGEKLGCEDNSIFTTDGEEVLGCSEWIRCTKAVFQHIIKLHNDSIRLLSTGK